MKTRKSYLGIILYCISFLLIGCNSPGHQNTNTEESIVEQLIASYRDSFISNPRAAIDTLSTVYLKIKDPVASTQLLNHMSICYYRIGEMDSALLFNQKIIDLYLDKPNLSGTLLAAINAYNNRGAFLQECSFLDTAIVCFKKAYKLLERSGRKESLIDVCINLADSYSFKSDYPQSSYYYRKALMIRDSLGVDDRYNYPIYSGMAKLYQNLENFDLAEYYYQEAEKYFNMSSDYERYVFANTRGNYYYIRKDYENALKWFRIAYGIVKQFPGDRERAVVEGNLGETFILKNEFDSAHYYLDKSSAVIKLLNQPSYTFYMNGLYASLALQEDNIREAEKLLLQPYDTALISTQYIYFHNKRLHQLYLLKNDYKNAYIYLNKVQAYDDSLRNVNIRNNINEIDFRYAQDTTLIKKDMQLRLSENRASQWKKISVLSIILFTLLVVIIVGIILYQRKIRELRRQKQKAAMIGLKMEIIRNRLSPHFVFNALNSILPELNANEELKQSFQLLIKLLRNNLQISEKTTVTLRDEIKFVDDYIQFQSYNMLRKISVRWEIAEEVSVETAILSMSIQLPVENAVKYAFTSDHENPVILIKIANVSDTLHIDIEDNGKGFFPGQHMNDIRGTGNGLKTLYQTIEILNTQNENKILFNVENRQQHSNIHGTRVSFVIPLEYRFEL